mgnify:CR=1 FL=1
MLLRLGSIGPMSKLKERLLLPGVLTTLLMDRLRGLL